MPRPTIPLLVASRLVGQTGDRFTLLALPLFTVAAGATPAEAGLVFTVYAAPGVGALLLGGPLDRSGRLRGVCAAVDVLRAALLVVLVLLVPGLGGGGWPLVLLVTFACGCCAVVFDVGLQGYLPRAAGGTALRRANTWFARAQAAADVVGPPAAGAVLTFSSSGTALLVDAASFLVSGLLLVAVPERPAPAGARSRPARGWSSGLAHLTRDPVLRNVVTTMLVLNLGGAMIGALWIVYATLGLGIGTTALGVVTALGGVSALAASAVVGRVVTGRALPRRVAWAFVGALLGLLCIPAASLAVPVVFLAGFQILFSACALLVAVSATVIRQERTPDELQASVYGVVRSGQDVVLPLGGGVATVLASATSVTAAVLVGALTAFLALPCVVAVRRSRPAAPGPARPGVLDG